MGGTGGNGQPSTLPQNYVLVSIDDSDFSFAAQNPLLLGLDQSGEYIPSLPPAGDSPDRKPVEAVLPYMQVEITDLEPPTSSGNDFPQSKKGIQGPQARLKLGKSLDCVIKSIH